MNIVARLRKSLGIATKRIRSPTQRSRHGSPISDDTSPKRQRGVRSTRDQPGFFSSESANSPAPRLRFGLVWSYWRRLESPLACAF